MAKRTVTYALLIAALNACNAADDPGDGDGGDLSPCDPFEGRPQPIELSEILGVGKDAAGIYYVVDSGPGDRAEPRVFVSDGDALERQRITGSAQSSTPDSQLSVFSLADHDPELTLALERTGDEVRMGVVEGEFGKRTFVIGEDGEELTVVPADEIEDLELRNLPGGPVLEYAAELEDDRLLVVTRPEDDWSYDDFRLFLGPKGELAEREVHEVTRARDGGSTTIAFDLDGDHATAEFPVEFDEDTMTFAPGQATLTVDGKTEDLTLLDDAPSGADYLCR